MTLVFISMFAVIFISLANVAGLQYRQGALQSQDELAFQVAESGLNFGRWRLAHAATDLSAVTQAVVDQFSGVVGTYIVTFTPPPLGSTTITLKSVGYTVGQPNRRVTLTARYGLPSLAKYAFITNGDAYYKSTISGPVHANGGIRMDGTSNSIMTSAKATYTCQTYHGCNPTIKPGIWGGGQNPNLWQFPAPAIDYNSLSANLQAMKTAAQAAGTYWGPSGKFGYHILFNAGGTYSIYRVTKLKNNVLSWTLGDGWVNSSHDIDQEQLLSTVAVPEGGVVYAEDRLWVNGTITNHVSVAAGVFPDTPATNVDIILNGNITYGGIKDGSRVFAAVAQRSVLIPFYAAPDVLTLEGAFIAQKGFFGRRYYFSDSGSQNLRTSLTRYGMTASNGIAATAYISGSQVVSGYKQSTGTYDPNLLYFPPPFFPTTGSYQFISWEQQ